MIFGLHRLKKSDFSAVFDILMLNLGQDLTPSFENCLNPDECYYATALSVLGKPPLQGVTNQTLTWSTGGTDHERNGELAPPLASRMVESDAFFAVGFQAESTIRDDSFHLPS